MNLLHIYLMLCIGSTAGWLVSLYVKGGERRLLINVAAALFGALVAGSALEYFFPDAQTVSAMIAATAGAALALFAVHPRKRADGDADERKSTPAG